LAIGQALIIPPIPEDEGMIYIYDGGTDGRPPRLTIEDGDNAIEPIEPPRSQETDAAESEAYIELYLYLPQKKDFGDTVRVLVELTPSDTGNMSRVINRSIKKEDFPRLFQIPMTTTGSAEIKVYLDDELVQTNIFNANE
jgi:hypothetical protein